MRFPESFLDEIRNRVPISQVIATRVTWDRRKTNQARGDYWACCPFHGEKTPSFHCEDPKGRYHCFGCGQSGDHFRFLMELDGIGFAEAVEKLADQAGLPLPTIDPEARRRDERRATLFDVMEMASRYFVDELNGREGARARAYLRDRGLSPQVQQTFAIGYAPDSRNGLKEYLAGHGVSKDQIEACGLVVSGPEIAVSYDRFRDRIMFPIPDSRGRIIAFGGRALRGDVPAKYINSPETELFHKSKVLFNYARARGRVRETNRVIVAEGYIDVIALHAAGYQNSVAPLGTALTEFQLDLLWRLHHEPILCFDGDKAGLAAAYRAADMALPLIGAGRSLRFIILPEGKDPDDVIRENGPSAMGALLDDSVALADLLWTRESGSGIFDTPERRAQLEQNVRSTIARIRDESVRRHYLQDFQERLATFFGTPSLSPGGRTGRRQTPRGTGSHGASDQRQRRFSASPSLLNSAILKRGGDRMPMRETALVAGMIHHPAILSRLFDEFANLPLSSPPLHRVQGIVLDILSAWQADNNWPDGEALSRLVAEKGAGDILERMNAQLRENRVWQALPGAAFEDALDGWLQAYRLHSRRHRLESELREAEEALAANDSEENFERLVQIRHELELSEGTEASIEGFGISSGRSSGGL